MSTRDFKRQLSGYGLTTAEILYRRPDHPWLLQTYIWQEYDLAPDFPEMRGFLKFWQETLDGPLHSVRYIHRKLISATEWRALKGEFVLQRGNRAFRQKTVGERLIGQLVVARGLCVSQRRKDERGDAGCGKEGLPWGHQNLPLHSPGP